MSPPHVELLLRSSFGTFLWVVDAMVAAVEPAVVLAEATTAAVLETLAAAQRQPVGTTMVHP